MIFHFEFNLNLSRHIENRRDWCFTGDISFVALKTVPIPLITRFFSREAFVPQLPNSGIKNCNIHHHFRKPKAVVAQYRKRATNQAALVRFLAWADIFYATCPDTVRGTPILLSNWCGGWGWGWGWYFVYKAFAA